MTFYHIDYCILIVICRFLYFYYLTLLANDFTKFWQPIIVSDNSVNRFVNRPPIKTNHGQFCKCKFLIIIGALNHSLLGQNYILGPHLLVN